MNYAILIISWAGYFAFHSFLAATSVRHFFEVRLGLGPQLYRIVYTMVSSVGILGLFFLMAVMESSLLFPMTVWVQYIGMVLAVWGVILIVAAFRKISGLAFLGLKKDESPGLVTDGVHGKIRHPIYAGIILIFLGMFLYTPTDVVLVSVLVIYAYLPVGIHLEERKLVKEYGDSYRAYKDSVPALLPKRF